MNIIIFMWHAVRVYYARRHSNQKVIGWLISIERHVSGRTVRVNSEGELTPAGMDLIIEQINSVKLEGENKE